MLVLTRKIGQRIVLPDLGVTVTVLASTGGKVRLGFAAPPAVPIHREDVGRVAPASGPHPLPNGAGTDDP
jgi:carbon storage regulator CsrA